MVGEIPEDATVIRWKLNYNRPIKALAAAMDLSIMYVSTEGDPYLYCINLQGKVLWKYRIPSGIKSISADIEGKHVSVASNKGGLFYIDSAGNLLWSYSLGRDIPVHKVSDDGSIVIAGTITSSGSPTMCILSKEGKVIRHLTMPGVLKRIDASYDGSAIVVGDVKNNIALYDKKGNKQWIYNMGKTLHDIKISQNGLHIFVVTNVLQLVSPSGKPRWKIDVPGGSLTHIEMSHDCSVNIASTPANLFRYDMKGKMLWNRENPSGFKTFRLSYRSYHIVMNNYSDIEYWDKYGYGIFSFDLPKGFRVSGNNLAVSHNGRYIVCGTENGYLIQFDAGKALARHLIDASKIFIEELKRLGSMPPDAEDNLQWAIESLEDGDIDHALMYGMQAYTGLENMLDSISKEKAEASREAEVREEKVPEVPLPGMKKEEALEKYRKALEAVFKDKEEPTESELELLAILRETLKISVDEHNELEEEARSKLAHAPPEIPPPTVETGISEGVATTPEAQETASETGETIEELLKVDATEKKEEPAAAALDASDENPPMLDEIKKDEEEQTSEEAPKKEEKREEFDMDSYVSSILGKYLKK